MNDLTLYRNKMAGTLLALTDIDASTVQEIVKEIEPTFYEKGIILLHQGFEPNLSYYVIEGCVRQYLSDENGKEVTVEFYKENQSINIFSYVDANGNSFYSLECLEDCVMATCPYIPEIDMDEAYPEYIKMLKHFFNAHYIDIQLKFAAFKAQTPEERFKSFVEKEADLLKRVPQTILASYLDITPETFSRFKKRFLNN